jgi:hypothetical protein
MPFVPKLQYSTIGRFEFESTRFPGFVQAASATGADSNRTGSTARRWIQLDTMTTDFHSHFLE